MDYDEIKKLIKHETSDRAHLSITIPGKSTDSLLSEGFEQDLFGLLAEEHERVDLFCKSKTGEIHRRLEHLDSLVRKLQEGIEPPKSNGRQLRKLSKLEEAVLRIGNDIQALSRFVGAQRLAFRKLVKKYQKWTGSSKLDNCFQRSVMNHSEYLGSRRDPLTPLLSKYTRLLESVRAPFDSAAAPNVPSQRLESAPLQAHLQAGTDQAAEKLYKAYESGSDVDVDAALFTVPQGRQGGRVAYWIHQDNLVQARVLLQTFARVRGTSRQGSVSSPLQTSPEDSPTTELHRTSTGGSSDDGSRAGFAVFDNAKTFGKRRIKVTDGRTGGVYEHGPRAAASIHYSENDKSFVVALSPSLQPLKVKRKDLRRLSLETSSSLVALDVGPLPSRDSQAGTEEVGIVQQWFQERPNVEPLVQVDYERTRFIGLSNTKSKGVWASLDTDIRWGNFSASDLADTGLKQLQENSFPHAVLEVRWEGQASSHLVQALDQGHIAARIPGFAIETHAVAASIEDMPKPSWFSSLEKDIRRTPSIAAPDLRRRLSEVRTANSSAGNTTSTTDGQSSEVFTGPDQASLTSLTDTPATTDRSKGKAKRQTHPRKKLDRNLFRPEPSQPSKPRYWNELDEDEEQAENEPYTILVNPDEHDVLSNAWSRLSSTVRSAFKRLPFVSRQPEKHSEQNPLLDPEACLPGSDGDSDSGTPSPVLPSPRHARRRYSTFPKNGRRRPKAAGWNAKSRDKLLFRLTFAAFFLAILFFVMSAVLEATGRRRYTAETNAIGILGIVASVVLAILGLFFTFARQEGADAISRASAVVAMIIVCTANAILVLVMVRGME